MKKSLYYFFVLGSSAFLIAGSNATFTDPAPQRVETSAAQSENAEFTVSEPEAVPEPGPVKPEENWQMYTIESGDSLSSIFSRFEINKRILHDILASTTLAKELAAVYPGKEVGVLVDEAGLLNKLRYRPNAIDTLEVVRTESGYTTTKSSRTVERRTSHAHGVIQSSLYRDAKSAGLTDRLVMEIAKIFAWDIDFALEIRPGDEFTVIYEQLFLEGEFYGSGKILAAEFINKGKSHTAVRFANEDGTVGYYTPDGKSLRTAFLRTPVQFAHISSHFNLRRRHPVLNRIRAHKGVDYAASTGTPVRSTGDGKITFRGYKGGYGRVVIVQHGKNYSTLYAHLSKFGKAHKGRQVHQGQTIGYVGKSGLATGPHLHYEFRINGVHRNPLTVKLPNTLPIEQDSLDRFKIATAPLVSQLELYRTTLLAQAHYKQDQAQ